MFAFLHRFVVEGHIPYFNAYQHFPEKMKLYGLDLRIFCVEVIFFSLNNRLKTNNQLIYLVVF